MEIGEALERHCAIPGDRYFLAVYGHDGDVTTFFSPGQLSHDEAESSFFDAEKFQQICRQPNLNGQFMSSAPFGAAPNLYDRQPNEDQSRSAERRRVPPGGGDDWDITSASARKRHRVRHYNREESQEETMSVMTRRGLKIGDSQAVYDFYEQRFKNCQQSACKLIAKAWVKVLAPKKQSTHPYTGSDERAPEWWPKPWGTSKEERVRHKEPDHLYKRERVHLLIHILRLAVEPAKRQLPDLQKLNINVKKIEDATWEALSGWLAESEANSSKKPWISDIFRVARMEERYRDGMLDGSAAVYVATDEGAATGHGSENDEMRGVQEDEEDLTPPRAPRAPVLLREDRSPITSASGPLVGNLPMRAAPFPAQQGQILDYMPPHQPHQFDEGSLPPHSQPAVNPAMPVDMVHDPSAGDRRGSLFHNFHAHGGNSVFPTQWQPVSNVANPNQGYGYANQQAHADPQAYANANAVPLPSAEHQGYLPSNFDGIPRPSYDASTMFRQPPLGSGAGAQSQAYPYSPQDGAGLRGTGQGMNSESRHED